MQTQNEKGIVETLADEAKAHYERGAVDEALETWRKLLLLDPTNESAAQGVKQCEMQVAGILVAPADHAGPAPPVADGPLAPLEFDFSNLDPRAAPAAPAEPAEPPDPSRQTDGIEFGEPLEMEPLTLEQTSLVAPESAAAVQPAAASAADPRADELYADARAILDGGDVESAGIILSRLFLIDEHHANGRALEAQIKTLESGAAPLTTAVPPTPSVPEAGAADEPLGDLIAPLLDAPPSPAPQRTGGDADEQRYGTEWQPPVAEDEAAETEIETAAGFGAKLIGSMTRSTIGWVAGLLAVAVLAVAFLLFRGTAGGESVEASGVPANPAVTQASDPQTTQPANPTPAPQAVDLPPQARADKVRELLAAGAAAFENGDWAAAVAAYGDALRLDPGQRDAIRRLQVASERHDEQRQLLAKWEQAIRSFNNGTYRSALTVLYRMPEGYEVERVERYKRNGWYNMGVVSLQSADCLSAEEHFNEARGIDAADPGVVQGLEVAAQCRAGLSGIAYQALVQGLRLRQLED